MEAVGEWLAHARALIFDCDGTLVDSGPIYADAWAAGFRLSGLEMSPAWYRERKGMSEHVLLEAFERDHNVIVDRSAVVAHVRQTYLNSAHGLKEIEAVAAIARRNHGRIPLAVASGGPRSIVVPTLCACGLDGLFDVVVTLDDVGNAKPAPDLFLEAARRLGVPPEECLVFEDSEQGMQAAASAKIRAIDVRNA